MAYLCESLRVCLIKKIDTMLSINGETPWFISIANGKNALYVQKTSLLTVSSLRGFHIRMMLLVMCR
uniref:Uncharacterized protein n=1 Tax=Anopheles atroparvus TaxID=41427 RepID=A0AAG5DI27_ANOAO